MQLKVIIARISQCYEFFRLLNHRFLRNFIGLATFHDSIVTKVERPKLAQA